MIKYSTRKTTLKTMPGTKQSINHYQSYSSPVCFLVQGTRGSWLLILIAGSVWVGTKDIPRRGFRGGKSWCNGQNGTEVWEESQERDQTMRPGTESLGL